MNTIQLNLTQLSYNELIEIEGGFVIAMLCICYAAGVAIGLMLV